MQKSPLLQLTSAATLALIAACQPTSTPAPNAPSVAKPVDVLATVNGAPITATDVRLRVRANAHQAGTETTSEQAQSALDQLVKQELAAQRATALGYDSDPGLQERIREKEAELQAMRRKELADTYFRRELATKSRPTDADLQRHYEANVARIRTELHILQIFRRDEATIRDVERRLAAQEPFEAVAATLFPSLPEGERKPWDLGFLAWKQLPEPWLDVVYALQPGQTSGVIKSGKDRFWILKLVEKRENTSLTFEQVKPALAQELEEQSSSARRAALEAELVSKAQITYAKPPTQ